MGFHAFLILFPELGGFFVHLFAAFGAHAVGGGNAEVLAEIFFDLHPFALLSNFATPGAQFQITAQVVKTTEQQARQSPHDGPNVENDECLEGTVAPIAHVRAATKQNLG